MGMGMRERKGGMSVRKTKQVSETKLCVRNVQEDGVSFFFFGGVRTGNQCIVV